MPASLCVLFSPDILFAKIQNFIQNRKAILQANHIKLSEKPKTILGEGNKKKELGGFSELFVFPLLILLHKSGGVTRSR